MDNPTVHSDPFVDDKMSPMTPLLAVEHVHSPQGHNAIIELNEPAVAFDSRSPEGPPIYQQPFFASDNKVGMPAIAIADQQPVGFVPAAIAGHALSTIPASLSIISSATEAEWYETLRELQANLENLRAARKRTSTVSSLLRAPDCIHPRNLRAAEDNVRETRVLEELILAGMRRLSRIHPDPFVQAEWQGRAEDFSHSSRSRNGDANGAEGDDLGDLESCRTRRFRRRVSRLLMKNDNDSALVGLSKAVAILLVTPLALNGVVVFAVGVMLYASGKVVVELGHMITFGKLR